MRLLIEILSEPYPPALLIVCGYRGDEVERSPALKWLFERRWEDVGAERREIALDPLSAAEVPYGLLGEAVDSAETLDLSLAALRAGRLLRSAGSRDSFEACHDRVREAFAGSLAPARCAECRWVAWAAPGFELLDPSFAGGRARG